MVDNYDASSIVVLKSLDSVRKRPAMYFGSLEDGTGLCHMLMEVVSNSVDQFLAGKATIISVFLHKNGEVEVIDDGEGMPVYNDGGTSAIEEIMTTLHASATWDNHWPHTHIGTTIGVGLAPVNALCDYFEIDSFKDGIHWHIRFEDGETNGLENKGANQKRGTRMLFHPSTKYFTRQVFDESAISAKFEELAFLCPGLRFIFLGKTAPNKVYYCPKGIIGYLEHIMPLSRGISLPVLHFSTTQNKTKVELALCWSEGQGEQRSFANYLCTKDGGVHVDAVILGLVKAASSSSGSSNDIERWVTRICKGLYFIVHVNIADPKFAQPTKDRLINEEVFNALIETTYQRARQYFIDNADFLYSLERQDNDA